MKLPYIMLFFATLSINAYTFQDMLQDMVNHLGLNRKYNDKKNVYALLVEQREKGRTINQNFDYKDLSGLDLGSVYFFGAYLLLTNFQKANLKNAKFNHSYFGGTNFKEADLKRADFRNTKPQCYFQYANLKEANFKGVDFCYADFEGANLDRTNFENARIVSSEHYWNVNLTDALITKNTNFCNTTRYDDPEMNRDWLTVMGYYATIGESNFNNSQYVRSSSVKSLPSISVKTVGNEALEKIPNFSIYT